MAKHIFKGNGPPTFAPMQVGHHYVDLLNRSTYISVGIIAPSDWILLTVTSNEYTKAGIINASNFLGAPRKATVTFTIPVATPYGVNISGVDSRVWTIESPTTTAKPVQAAGWTKQ